MKPKTWKVCVCSQLLDSYYRIVPNANLERTMLQRPARLAVSQEDHEGEHEVKVTGVRNPNLELMSDTGPRESPTIAHTLTSYIRSSTCCHETPAIN